MHACNAPHVRQTFLPTGLRLLGLLLMFWQASLLSGCSQSPTEDVVKANINSLAEAIRSKDADTALEVFHDNFVSDKGHNKDWVKRTLLLYTLRHDKIQLVLSNISVTVADPATASAEFHVLATGGRGLIPDQGGAYRVYTEWRQDGGDWLLVYAKWKKALAAP